MACNLVGKKRLLYLTGRGGNHCAGLGEYLKTLDVVYTGLSITDEFLKADFDQQLNEIDNRIRSSNPTHVIANSYGAYLLLHALLGSAPLQANVLLLSPILGKGVSHNRMVRPPMASRLLDVFRSGYFPKPSRLELHMGESDMPELATAVAKDVRADLLNIIQGQGHTLDYLIVQEIINDFL